MEPQGTTIASPLQTRRQSKTFRLGKTTLRVRAHVQAVGLDAETKNRPALSRRGDFSLDRQTGHSCQQSACVASFFLGLAETVDSSAEASVPILCCPASVLVR